MAGPHPAVAVTRSAVRAALFQTRPEVVVVAVSGGADSLALLAATVFEAQSPRHAIRPRVVGVCVDHGLQTGSAEIAAQVADQMAVIGADAAVTVRVDVDSARAGVEAGARAARYAALVQVAERHSACHVFLGHTRDDQAETVLLGLVRGSGGRSLAGMRPEFVRDGLRFTRPLMEISREETHATCGALGIKVWHDPHNLDDRFLRVRIRHAVLPRLEADLGPGIGAALARTAAALRDDVEALDALAEEWREQHPNLEIGELASLRAAIRTRVLRAAAVAMGARDSELTREHVLAIDALITTWHGQVGVDLPGPLRVARVDDELRFT